MDGLTNEEIKGLANQIARFVDTTTIQMAGKADPRVQAGMASNIRTFISVSRNCIDRQEQSQKGMMAVATITALAFAIGKIAEEYGQTAASLKELGLFQVLMAMLGKDEDDVE